MTPHRKTSRLSCIIGVILGSLLLLPVVGVLSAPADEAGAPGDSGPNVVLILVDDLGWRDLSCQGSEYYETPNIDRLAAQGMRFTDAYAACAVCSPTRAAVLTGRYPARTGVTDWIRARFQRGGIGTPPENPVEYVGGPGRRLLCPPNPYWLEHEEITVAEALGPAGYRSCHIGKWHLGDDEWYPGRQGFDLNLGGCDYGQPPSYFDPYRTKRLPQGIPTLEPRREGEYLTDREGDEAVKFIRASADRKFFLYYAPYAVHTPIQAKTDLTARYREKDPDLPLVRATYAAMIESVDEAVGKIAAALNETGIASRTLLVFTSDNGGLLGPTDNRPLRSGKGFPHEGGIRVPLIVRWPGKIPASSTSRAPVVSVDLLPTILEATGATLPAERAVDGVSLLAHLRSGGEVPAGREAIFWHFPHYRGSVTPYSIVRAGDWKLIRWHEGPTFELYDLAGDPGETRDLAGKRPGVVDDLDSRLMAHLESVGARLPAPNPEYRPEEHDRPRVLILGDSISIGYTPGVRELLAGEAEVIRPTLENGRPENCAGTNRGVEHVDRWLAIDGGDWDVIHFNFGLHDLKHVDPQSGRNSNDPAHPRQAPPGRYERQLREIVGKLKATGAELVFGTTTPVPAGGVRPYRSVEDPGRYNAIAREIMVEHGVLINDLYRVALPRLGEIQRPVNVHFTPEGSRLLAGRVAERIRAALRDRRKR